MASKLMCHVVAGYPSVDEGIELMLGMQNLGIEAIEVQIPFSDPIADGETIMRANDKALAGGMDTKGCFDLIKHARKKGLKTDIYIMSYIQKVVHLGIEDFCRLGSGIGAKGLIIPDLPYDSPEYEELAESAKDNSLEIVPVVSPGMSRRRLSGALAGSGQLVYLTSNKGITGNKLSVSKSLKDFAGLVKDQSPASALAIGFGIQNRRDVKEVLEYADMAVVGSSVIREIDKSGVKAGLEFIKSLAS